MQDDRRTTWWPAVLVGLLAPTCRLIAGPWPIDDAYITFRYARNLANGLGLVYNPGEAVLGTSTPTFTLVLALIAALTRTDMAWIALVVSALADAIVVLLIHRIASRLGLPLWAAVACSLTWALYPLAWRYALSGMETSLASLLILGAFALHLRGHQTWTMALVGLAVLTRLDALAAAFVILVAQALEGRRCPWRSILVLAATLLPWLIFATWEYGSPLPQSLQAKSHSVYLAPRWENALQILYYVAGLVLAGRPGMVAHGISVYRAPAHRLVPIAMAAMLLIIWGLGARSAIRANRRWAAFFAFPLLFSGTYALLGLRGGLMAEWYLVPLAPFFFLGIFAGLVDLCRRLPELLSPSVVTALSTAITLVQVIGLDLGRTPGRNPLVPRMVWTEREELYQRAGTHLRPRLRPGEVVAAAEIGAIGYYCDCQILDTVGLVSPEVLAYYPLPLGMYVVNYAVPPDLIRDRAPAYVVSLDVFIRKSLLEAPWFRRDYEVLWQQDTTAFGSRRLLVFGRIAR